MSHQPRRIFTPVPSRKRKEREVYFPYKPPAMIQPPPDFTATKAAAHPHGSNRLLAGYMAYEFLTKGTMFGQKYDPAKAAAVSVAGASADLKKVKLEAEPNLKSYAELANVMRANEAHIPGICNPAQLAHWMQM